MLIRGAAAGLWMGICLSSSSGWAIPIWTESADGDPSSVESAPTVVSIGQGTETISGSVGARSGDTRDFVTFTIAPGLQLAGLLLRQWEDGAVCGPANTGFHAIKLGATSFVPSQTSIGSFLGAAHVVFGPPGTDLLPELAAAAVGEIGFATALGAGTYSYVIQQTESQLNRYALDLIVTPEPTTVLLLSLGLGCPALCRLR